MHPINISKDDTDQKRPIKLLDQVRQRIRMKQYSIRTEDTYVSWIRRFIFFHNKRHPKEMGKKEVEQFLTDLAVNRNVAASTQNLVLSSVLFLYREVLHIELPWLSDVKHAKKARRSPVVLTCMTISITFLFVNNAWHP